MSEIIAKNECNLQHFYSLVKEQTYQMQQLQHKKTFDTRETQTPQPLEDQSSNPNTEQLCVDLQETIWQKRFQSELDFLNKQKRTLIEREELILHKEKRLKEVYNQLKIKD